MPLSKHQGKRNMPLWLVILVAAAVISFWRGLWGLMDVYLFPNNYSLSLISSVIIGLLILILTRYARKELI
jgi:uncharacterized membrane-anchored protein